MKFESEGNLNVVVSGVSTLCSKSREGCNWAFHSTTCKFIEGYFLSF